MRGPRIHTMMWFDKPVLSMAEGLTMSWVRSRPAHPEPVEGFFSPKETSSVRSRTHHRSILHRPSEARD